jgi:hypothetical protein
MFGTKQEIAVILPSPANSELNSELCVELSGDNETIFSYGRHKARCKKPGGEAFYLILRRYRISDQDYFEHIGLLVLSLGQSCFTEEVTREITVI